MLRAVCIGASFVLFTFFAVGCRTGQMTPKELATDVKQSIPLQSTPDQVIAHLDRRKIEHSSYAHSSIMAIIRDQSK
jgi:hypothetical protein